MMWPVSPATASSTPVVDRIATLPPDASASDTAWPIGYAWVLPEAASIEVTVSRPPTQTLPSANEIDRAPGNPKRGIAMSLPGWTCWTSPFSSFVTQASSPTAATATIGPVTPVSGPGALVAGSIGVTPPHGTVAQMRWSVAATSVVGMSLIVATTAPVLGSTRTTIEVDGSNTAIQSDPAALAIPPAPNVAAGSDVSGNSSVWRPAWISIRWRVGRSVSVTQMALPSTSQSATSISVEIDRSIWPVVGSIRWKAGGSASWTHSRSPTHRPSTGRRRDPLNAVTAPLAASRIATPGPVLGPAGLAAAARLAAAPDGPAATPADA